MYGKIIFNNIEYVKLFPVFNASTAVFVFYPHFIHMYSTLNPHKIAELSTPMPYFISEKKTDSVSISVQCCTPTFRKSYFYLPVYPFSEQFFPLLFTDLIIIFCFQSVKDFCSTRSDALCKTAQCLHEKCRINAQIDTPSSQKQSPWCFPGSFGKPFGLQRKDQRKKKRQKIPSLHAQDLIVAIGCPLSI